MLSLDGARAVAGAVYRLCSSHPPCGVPCRGNGNMPDVVLVLDDTGDSATGEKYESPPRCPGEGIEESCWVCKLRGGFGRPIGKRGGGARAIPAKDWVLSPVVDLERRLVLEAFRVIPELGCPGYIKLGGGYSSSSSSSSC